ncbi:MAG: DNA recombination protein RmuC [Planctomycetia bacterium]|jgi:DNA recombination protein RmuC|nr:DNA recombination protein RmuC [Planctomycetia bacterium]
MLILLVIVLVMLLAVLLIQVVLLLRNAGAALQAPLENLEKVLEKMERSIRDDLGRNRAEAATASQQAREELAATLKNVGDSLNQQISGLTQSTLQRLDMVRNAVEQRLTAMQADNALKLDQMRATVDEKLQNTLEKRLGESFKLVSDRLEQVHKGLGEMQTLAGSVGDLKRVMTNVKTRGTWGEVLVENLLSQILSPGQFEKNFKPRESGTEVVEFAIKLPGRAEDGQESVWLPIDSKFPKEDYEALGLAQDRADVAGVDAAGKSLENRIKLFAQDMATKYLNPPRTTDFGIMFLPSEGLYAEVIRRGTLVEQIQRDRRVVIAGPTTLAALLNSLQMGFRTLAIQKRSSEVWKVLGAVKTEFGKFGDLLDGVKQKLDQAAGKMDETARKSRTIAAKLRSVEELPTGEAATLLNLEATENNSSG